MENNKPLFYCNHAEVCTSIYDFRIGFGVKKNAAAPISNEDIDVYIVMSPQHAKSLVSLLLDNLKAYEKVFGNINLEPDKEALRELNNATKVGEE